MMKTVIYPPTLLKILHFTQQIVTLHTHTHVLYLAGGFVKHLYCNSSDFCSCFGWFFKRLVHFTNYKFTQGVFFYDGILNVC